MKKTHLSRGEWLEPICNRTFGVTTQAIKKTTCKSCLKTLASESRGVEQMRAEAQLQRLQDLEMLNILLKKREVFKGHDCSRILSAKLDDCGLIVLKGDLD